MKRIIYVVVFTLCSAGLFAQDLHFSQYTASPLNLNPAMTGVFSGNYRFSAIYRSQWNSVLKDENVPMYRTFSASYDMRFQVLKNDAVGVGVVFFNDVAGQAKFGTNHVSLTASYIKALNRDGSNFLTLGVQLGGAYRSIDIAELQFGLQFDGNGFDPSKLSGEEGKINNDHFWFLDLSTGLFWYYVQKKRTNYWAGVSISHVNQPNQTFYNGGSAPLPIRISGSAGLQVPLGSQVDLLPSVLVLSQGPAFETNLGTYIKLLFEPNEPQGNAFYIGPWYRIVRGEYVKVASDALILATRFDFSSFSFGFSYDLNFSELTDASNARGAFEVSAIHVGSFKQKSKVKYCPRF